MNLGPSTSCANMKYLEDSRLTQLTSDLTGAFLNTRGSGNGGRSSFGTLQNSTRSRGGKGKKKNGQKQQGGAPRKNKQAQRSTSPEYYAYNPEGYSTYKGTESYSDASSSSSCRIIYGRVEAYTTKRAGSDKKVAYEVGLSYAHEMERFNEAVAALKRKHALERQDRENDKEGEDKSEGVESRAMDEVGRNPNAGTKCVGTKISSKKVEQRRRSRSLDGVTFAASASPSIKTYDTTAKASEILAPLEEGEETLTSHVKRDLPLEGILKQPSSNKRCRSTSFDVSTGPSTYATSSHRYHRSESSSSLLAGSMWSTRDVDPFPLSVVHPTLSSVNSIEDDSKVLHPLIPQPSLYQSSLGEHNHTSSAGGYERDKKVSSKGIFLPTMVPRRLVTDLILTLNASFPDYDFGDAQVSDFSTLSTPEAMRQINSKLGEFAATTDEGRGFLPRFWSSLDDVLGGLKECDVYSYAPREGSTGDDDPMEFLTTSMAVDEIICDDIDIARRSDREDGIIGVQGTAPTVMFTPSGGGRIVSSDMMSNKLDAASEIALDHPNETSPSSNFSDNCPPRVTLWSMNYFFVSRSKKRIVLFACVQTMRTPRGNYGDYEQGYLSDKYSNDYGENNVVFDEARREDGIVQMQEGNATTDDDDHWIRYENYQDGVDMDGDVDQGENDFDTGALSVPSQVA